MQTICNNFLTYENNNDYLLNFDLQSVLVTIDSQVKLILLILRKRALKTKRIWL